MSSNRDVSVREARASELTELFDEVRADSSPLWPTPLDGDGHDTWVVHAADEPVGFVVIEHLDDAGGARHGALTVWVRETVRGRGVGRQAVTAALAGARHVGYTSVEAVTDPANIAAVRCLTAAGFEPVDGAFHVRLG